MGFKFHWSAGWNFTPKYVEWHCQPLLYRYTPWKTTSNNIGKNFHFQYSKYMYINSFMGGTSPAKSSCYNFTGFPGGPPIGDGDFLLSPVMPPVESMDIEAAAGDLAPEPEQQRSFQGGTEVAGGRLGRGLVVRLTRYTWYSPYRHPNTWWVGVWTHLNPHTSPERRCFIWFQTPTH